MPGDSRGRTDTQTALPPWCRLLLIVAVAAELGSCLFSFARAASGGVAVDFLAFDVGGRLVADDPHHLYLIAEQNAELSRVLGYHAPPVSYLLYVNPPFVAELLRPLAALPLQIATDVFLLLSVLALMGSFAVARRALADVALENRTLISAALVLTSSAAYSLLLGQWGPMLLFIALWGMWLMKGGRDLLGGAVLALLLVKPQVAYLVPFALLAGRNVRAAAGFLGATVLLAVVSVGIVGLAGAGDYINALRGYAEPGVASANSLTVPDLAARIVGHPELATALSAGLAVLAAVALVFGGMRWRISALDAVGLALAASLVLAPHGNMQDFVILSAGVLVFVSRRAAGSLLFLCAADLTLGLWPLGVARPLTPILVAAGLAAAVMLLRPAGSPPASEAHAASPG